jgi:hypothetical protein
VDAAMRAAAETMDRAGRTLAAPLPADALRRDATARAARTSRDAIAGLGITADTPITQAAAIFADELRAVPGAQNHARLRLAELDARGPRAMQALWRLARPRLASRYGAMTVGDLLAGYPEGSGSRRQIDRRSHGATLPAN